MHETRPPRRSSLTLALLLLVGACSAPSPSVIVGPQGPAGENPSLSGTIRLLLFDELGAPIPQATATTWPRGIEGSSDAEGLAEIADLPLGSYRLTIAADGYQLAVLESVPVAADSVTEADLTLILIPPEGVLPNLIVTSRRASGLPLVGALVDVDGGTWSELTDEQGEAAFYGVDAGSWDISVTPPSGQPAMPRGTQGVDVAAGELTELLFEHSGRPPESATWLGSAACDGCHPSQAARHAASRHASTWSTTPVPGLAAALAADTSVDLPDPHGGTVTIRLFADAAGDHLSLSTDTDSETWDITGYYGGRSTAQVPFLSLDGGLAPAPITWRFPGTGNLAAPVFVNEVRARDFTSWIDSSGAISRDSLTGGPPEDTLEARACIGCHATGYELIDQGGLLRAWASDGLGGEAVERAIGCESCHGPGSGHAEAPLAERADLILQPGKLDAEQADEICAQCHSRGTSTTSLAGLLPFPYTEEGPHRPGQALADHRSSSPLLWPGGSVAGANQQWDDFVSSPHVTSGTTRLRCTDCHDAHGPRPDGDGGAIRQQLLADPDDNSLCLSCHGALNFPGPNDPRDHTRHNGYDPGGPWASGRCVGCHMPRTAARFDFSEHTGGGELASHAFNYTKPQESVDAFDAAGLDSLPVGDFPPSSCGPCHRVQKTRRAELGMLFPGPAGEPTERATHEALQSAFSSKFPGAP